MGRGLSHPPTTRGSERILKIGQYLAKLCVDYSGLLFGPACIFTLSRCACRDPDQLQRETAHADVRIQVRRSDALLSADSAE